MIFFLSVNGHYFIPVFTVKVTRIQVEVLDITLHRKWFCVDTFTVYGRHALYVCLCNVRTSETRQTESQNVWKPVSTTK